MLSFARRVSLVAAVLAMAACDRSDNNPTGPLPARAQLSTGGTERVVEESFYDLSDSYTSIDCDNGQASELVKLEGRLFQRFTVQYNPAGGIHVGFHTMPVDVKGVGVVSGEEYRVKEQDQASYNQRQLGAVGAYRQTLTLVGRSSGSKYSLVAQGHYAINANGEFAAYRDKLVLQCEG